MLRAFSGGFSRVNDALLCQAFDSVPSVILDCGNAANVPKLFPRIPQERLHDVFVVNVEAIYRFRQGLLQVDSWINEYDFKQLVITTIHTLFSYDDTLENNNVLLHCWELMRDISKRIPVFVGVASDEMHLKLAKKFADEIVEVK